MNDDLHRDVKDLKKVVWGDHSDPTGWPGIMAELLRYKMEQVRTNEILMELRNAALGVICLVGTGFITALLAVVWKLQS